MTNPFISPFPFTPHARPITMTTGQGGRTLLNTTTPKIGHASLLTPGPVPSPNHTGGALDD